MKETYLQSVLLINITIVNSNRLFTDLPSSGRFVKSFLGGSSCIYNEC